MPQGSAQMMTSYAAAWAFWRVAALEFREIPVKSCYRPFSCLRDFSRNESMASSIGMGR